MQEVLKAITKNSKQTERFAEDFARELLRLKSKRAIVVGLEGELGAGKTTFTKGFARGLGIRDKMKSPTFILMRVFKAKKRNLLHLDAYRDVFDFREYLKNKENILLVEWSDKARKLLPKKYFLFKFKHLKGNMREIKFYA